MRVDMPGGAWAELWDSPDDLTGEDEVLVRSAVNLKTGPEDGEGFSATAAGPALMEFAMLARVITSWSFSFPINPHNVRTLKRSQLKPLREAVKPFMEELAPEKDPNSLSGGPTATA